MTIKTYPGKSHRRRLEEKIKLLSRENEALQRKVEHKQDQLNRLTAHWRAKFQSAQPTV